MIRRLRGALPVAPLALVAYVPLLLTARGQIAADTKTYLYLDPGRLLSRAWSMWDPNIGLGTVTHQNIGYLWPMGPWFWTFERLGVPDWIAQRLWVGTIMFAAGAGVVFLARTLGVRYLPAILAGALVYELSPYVLHYAARISVLLLPWAALPWLIAIVQRALLRGGWRHPAIFALVVLTVGGVNATALVLAGIGPLLWVPFAVLAHHEVEWRDALRTVARIGVLTTATSLWWIAGLWVQGGWGIDILRYTETVATVARTSLSSEVLRGLGYWFFYGGDKLGSWIEPGRSYTQSLPLIAIGFVVPVLAIAAAAVTRWRYRAYFVTLVVLGTATAVGAYPYGSPSPMGALFKRFAASSSAGLALRSTPRALPLVVLGLAMLLVLGLSALAARNRRAALGGAVVVALVAAAGIPPLWKREVIGRNLQRPSEIPSYWQEAAAWLDERGDDTRVLELPGADFASYRWGNTVDPITPGLLDRPYVARELIPYGTPPSADLLVALDRRLQESILDPDAISPIARLFGVGDVVLRSDLQYERYRLPRPPQIWDWLQPTPTGLDDPVAFGEGVVNEAIPLLPLHDEVFLSLPPDVEQPPAVAAFPVDDPMPIVRARDADAPIVIAGDGEGLVEAASIGLIGGSSVVRYSAELSAAERADILLDEDASLILTDTNRKRGRRWATVRDNAGYTESAIEEPVRDDPSDARLDVFPDAPVEAFTTTVQRGVKAVRATTYGNPVTFTPEDRAALAIDGDPNTAWRVGAFSPVKGERWVLDLEAPVTTDHIEVVQPLGDDNRHITRLGIKVDGERLDTVKLRQRSLTQRGQRIDLGETRTFSRLELEVRGDNVGFRGRYDGFSGVGFAEVRVGDVRVDEIIQLPTDLLDERAAGHPLSVLLTRARSNPIEPTAGDEEPAMKRRLSLPAARTFELTGEARASVLRQDDDIDDLLGVEGASARSSRRLTGDLTTRASSTIDGDPSTSWTTGLFWEQLGEWVEIDLDEPTTIDALDLTLVADPYHSVLSQIRVTTDTGETTSARVPNVPAGTEKGHTEEVRVELGKPITGSSFKIFVRGVRTVRTTEWYSVLAVATPIAIAEIGLPARSDQARGRIPSPCRDDLLQVDGEPVSIRVSGDAVRAEQREGLDVELCGPDASGVTLGAGEHEIIATPGWLSGLDLDRLVLTSDADGQPAPPPPPGAAPTPSDSATVDVVDRGREHVTVDIEADEPVWLVLGQSFSPGWTATGLGEPQLVDGFANGWLVEPTGDGPTRITMRFSPQRTVNLALVLSLLAALVCVVLVVRGRRRPVADDVGDEREPAAWLVAPWAAVGDRPAPRQTIATAAVVGVAAALLSHPLIGLVVGVATAGALLLRRGPGLLAAGAIGSVGMAAAFTIAKQQRNQFPPDFGWPSFFSIAHHLAWLGLLLMVASVVVDRVRRRAGAPAPPRSP